MTAKNWPPSWLQGITRKRPETAQIVYAMIHHGITHGHVTSEDVKHVPVTSDKVWGAAAKYLKHCGFDKGPVVEATLKAAKGHLIRKWILADYNRAKRILDHMAADLCKIEPKETAQLNLL